MKDEDSSLVGPEVVFENRHVRVRESVGLVYFL